MTDTDTSYREDTSSIEVTFAVPVNISRENQEKLIEVLGDICNEYNTHHPGRIMWTFGMGSKMMFNPYTIGDDEEIKFDDSCLSIECAERERYKGEKS